MAFYDVASTIHQSLAPWGLMHSARHIIKRVYGMGFPDAGGFGEGSDSGGFGWIRLDSGGFRAAPQGGMFWRISQCVWAFGPYQNAGFRIR
jgi:hypothetical protein